MRRRTPLIIILEAASNSHSLAGVLAVVLFVHVAVAETADGPAAVDLQRALGRRLNYGESILDLRCALPCAHASHKAIPCNK